MREFDDNVRVQGTIVAPQLPTYVFHGATAGTARPTNAGVVIWIGSVEPTNANTTTDFWYDTLYSAPGGSGMSEAQVRTRSFLRC